MNLKDKILWLKHKLPFNGDWIFPTLTPEDPPQSKPTSKFTNVNNLDRLTKEIDPDSYDTLLSEAVRFTERAISRADHVRDKAKVLLGMASFMGAVGIGTLTFLFQYVQNFPLVAVWIVLGLLAATVFQFGLSLIRSLSAITREVVVDISLEDLITSLNESSDTKHIQKQKDFKKQLAIERLKASMLHEQAVTDRVNTVILAQTGVHYGLLFFLCLYVFLLLGVVMTPNNEKTTQGLINNKLAELDNEIVRLREGFNAYSVLVSSLSAFLDTTRRREDPPPIFDAAERALNESLKKFLPEMNLAPHQIERVASLALKQLTYDLMNDPGGEKSRIFNEWFDAWRESPTIDTQPPSDRQQKASAAVLPFFQRAVDLAIQAAGLPVEVATSARNKISELSGDAVSGFIKGLSGEVAKEMFGGSLRLFGSPHPVTPVAVTCQCSAPDKSPTPIDFPTQVRSFDFPFDHDKYEVSQDQFRVIITKAYPQFMSDLKKKQWFLRAYTDRTGTEEHNKILAEKRGNAVRAALMAMGVPKPGIHVEAMAEEKLPVPTNKGVSAPSNRIVQVEIK